MPAMPERLRARMPAVAYVTGLKPCSEPTGPKVAHAARVVVVVVVAVGIRGLGVSAR